ncbi:MAG: efflux RND transporter periplasmic adaptor subunit [Candidatus Nomurabacteria bacterium]|nr:efflux RND transporter periplasmic adaptor subunit [Candidatus Nomurabacteria bacterium]
MDKLKNTFEKIKIFLVLKKKAVLIILAIIIVICFFIFRSNKTNTLNTEIVKVTNLVQSVRATGQVISNTDLNLSFNKSGVVKSLKVKVGDTVQSGQILATLDQGQAQASLTQARGGLMSAQAKYGSSSTNNGNALSEVSFTSAQIDLENIKKAQDILVDNAYRTLLNSTLQAEAINQQDFYDAPIITGNYTCQKEGTYNLSTYGSMGGVSINYYGIENGNILITDAPRALGNCGLFLSFDKTKILQTSIDFEINIPNKHSVDYLKNYNAYQDALKARDIAVSNAESVLAQKKAELSVGGAEIVFAQGVLQSAEATYEDTIIRAPANGTVTMVDIKYGELANAGKSVITVQDIKNLYIEALINEANISLLKVAQSVEITFDAFGKDKKFTGVIAQIDPSAQTNNGVVNYKIKVSIDKSDETIRPGMNANINVLAGQKNNVLAVPNIAITRQGEKSFVDIITNDNSESNKRREVVTGFIGDNNLVEIVSGLSENEKVVLNTN